jgi:hypothetical protein
METIRLASKVTKALTIDSKGTKVEIFESKLSVSHESESLMSDRVTLFSTIWLEEV